MTNKTIDPELSKIAARLGKRGGLARTRNLSPERLIEIASMGGRAKAVITRKAKAKQIRTPTGNLRGRT